MEILAITGTQLSHYNIPPFGANSNARRSVLPHFIVLFGIKRDELADERLLIERANQRLRGHTV